MKLIEIYRVTFVLNKVNNLIIIPIDQLQICIQLILKSIHKIRSTWIEYKLKYNAQEYIPNIILFVNTSIYINLANVK